MIGLGAINGMSEPVLQCEGLTVVYPNGRRAVMDAGLKIAPGECLALVGESGCGKTTLARAVLGLLPAGAKVGGSIRICGIEVVNAPEHTLRKLRGLKAGFVAQDPFGACNPLARIEGHIAEAWRAHNLKPPAEEIRNRITSLGIADAGRRLRQYPHEWSGGMLQRAGITAAAAHAPPLLIADEPTSALDADHADSVLMLLRSLGAALLLISHDLHLIRRCADRIAVCRAGEIVECGGAVEIFERPQHAYTRKLLDASLGSQNRTVAGSRVRSDVVVEARGLGRTYARFGHPVYAVRHTDLRVHRGEIVGVCGPSGCGKSTLLRLLATIETPSAGAVFLGDHIATQAGTARLLTSRARSGYVMPIFQDPAGSLDRHWPVWRTVTEPLTAGHPMRVFGSGRLRRGERREIAIRHFSSVGLDGIDPEARPDELSAGQCQRVAIARALVASPSLIVADEPTSALDAVSRASVLRLLSGAADAGAGVIVVSHDERLLRALCDRILLMKDGNVREESH
ncbi:MAG: ABC transporter ATP-binding protein [Acidobacteria bacterium]|nr:ABC transporter ATP-binding protein [Acidobacteriota bacterium]